MARRKKNNGGQLLVSLIGLVFTIVFALGKVAIQLLLVPFRRLTRTHGNEKKNKGAVSGKNAGASKAQRLLSENQHWLDARWRRHAVGTTQAEYPYNKPITDNQVARLQARGVDIKTTRLQSMSTGQASDINSLFYPLSDSDAEILRFFTRPTTGMNSLSGEEAVVEILSNPVNAKAWESRPPSPLQKHFYRFVGLSQPKGLNATEMASHIQDCLDSLGENIEDEWHAFEDAFEEITGLEYRRDNDIKKSSLRHFQEAYESLKSDGKSFASDLTVDDIAERIDELHPGFRVS